jgi:uncharacterized protein (UPF0305 family)
MTEEKKALLPYGTEPSFPAIEVTYTAEWDGHLAGKARDTITARAEEIKEDYDDLSQLAKDTEFVNSIEKRYEVQVGKDYYAYETHYGMKFLSIIAPFEWTVSTQPEHYHGWFRLSPDGTWVRNPDTP